MSDNISGILLPKEYKVTQYKNNKTGIQEYRPL